MATTDENHSMNLIAMETQSTPFHPGNNPVLMLLAGLSCMIAGIVKLVQCGQQNQDNGNSENATIHGYEIARRAMIGLSFATAGLSLIWKAYQLYPGNNPVLMLVVGLSCIIAGIVNLVQFGRQNQVDDVNSENGY